MLLKVLLIVLLEVEVAHLVAEAEVAAAHLIQTAKPHQRMRTATPI